LGMESQLSRLPNGAFVQIEGPDHFIRSWFRFFIENVSFHSHFS